MTIICEPVLIQAASLRSAETGTHKQTKPNWTTGHKQKWWLKCGARTGFPCSHIFLRHHWYFLVYFILFLLVYLHFAFMALLGLFALFLAILRLCTRHLAKLWICPLQLFVYLFHHYYPFCIAHHFRLYHSV